MDCLTGWSRPFACHVLCVFLSNVRELHHSHFFASLIACLCFNRGCNPKVNTSAADGGLHTCFIEAKFHTEVRDSLKSAFGIVSLADFVNSVTAETYQSGTGCIVKQTALAEAAGHSARSHSVSAWQECVSACHCSASVR